MQRLFPFLLLAAPLVAAPAPKAKPAGPALYFPTTVGDTLVYEVSNGGVTSEQTSVVDKVEGKDGTYVVTLRRVEMGATSAETVRVSATEVAVVPAGQPGGLGVPMTLLKLPAKKGDEWTSEPAKAAGGLVMKSTVVGEEEIEVPAGKFKAMHIKIALTPAVEFAVWLAPGVGLVRTEAGGPGVKHVQVLKSFTPGK